METKDFRIKNGKYKTYPNICTYIGENEKYIFYKTKFYVSKIQKKKKHLITTLSNIGLIKLKLKETPILEREINRKKRQIIIKWRKILENKVYKNTSNYILERFFLMGKEYVAVLWCTIGGCFKSQNLDILELKLSRKGDYIVYPSFYSQGIKLSEFQKLKQYFENGNKTHRAND